MALSEMKNLTETNAARGHQRQPHADRRHEVNQ